jgi:hypothetical protein
MQLSVVFEIIRFHVRFHDPLGNPTFVAIVIVDLQSSTPV